MGLMMAGRFWCGSRRTVERSLVPPAWSEETKEKGWSFLGRALQ